MIKLESKSDVNQLATTIQQALEFHHFKAKISRIKEAFAKVKGFKTYNGLLAALPIEIDITRKESVLFAKTISVLHRNQIVKDDFLKFVFGVIDSNKEQKSSEALSNIPDFIDPTLICYSWARDLEVTYEKVMSQALRRVGSELEKESPNIIESDRRSIMRHCLDICQVEEISEGPTGKIIFLEDEARILYLEVKSWA